MPSSEEQPRYHATIELVVSAERHQQLKAIVEYVKELHYLIDPDMYRISLEQLEELQWYVEGLEEEPDEPPQYPGFKMNVSWKDLMFMTLVVEAADTYSHRRSTGYRAEGITDQGFTDLMKWLGAAEQGFRIQQE